MRNNGKERRYRKCGVEGKEKGCKRKEATGRNTTKRKTYEGSSGVAGCDPLKLCAKLRFPVPWR